MGDAEHDSAPHSSDDSSESFGPSAKKRKQHYVSRSPYPEVKVEKRIQKNARERQRVAQVRNQYNVLRRTLGDDFRTQKVNKVKTLRGAIEYIKSIRREYERLQNAKTYSPVCPHNCLEVSLNYSSTIKAFTQFACYFSCTHKWHPYRRGTPLRL